VRRSFLLLFGVAGLVLALDQWTKRWATDALAYREPVRVIGDLVRFTYTRNSGVAFGLGAGLPFPYAVFSIVAVGVILWLFLRHRTHTLPRQFSLALILGGALGNLVDRLTSGEVVDFILVGWRQWYWPVFNVADSAVTVGVILFGLTWASHSEERGHVREADGASPAADAQGPEHLLADDPETDDSRHDLASAMGRAHEQRGAARPLPGAGADRPVA
jgi:signal peptidase II